MTEHALEALRGVVGDEHVLADPALRAGHEVDWTGRYRGTALAVVRPADTAQVSAVLAICHARRIPVVPQGGNTGLVGGGVPRGGELVLSLRRLRALEPVDPVAGEAVAGAGVTLAELEWHAAGAGLDFGIDLAARDGATVGGMIATNAGGLHVLRHGRMRSQILGLEAVFADGSVVRRLSGGRNDSAGYDLAGLIAGSEGTLAVVTRARLRLVARLEARAVALLGLADVASAVALVGRLRGRLDALSAAELFFPAGLELVLRHVGTARPFSTEPGVYLLVECAGRASPLDELVAAVADGPEVLDAAIADDPPSRRRLWQLREAHTEAIAAEGVPHKLDVALPLGNLAAFVDRVGPAVERAAPGGARTILFGHVAEGNLHVNILGPAPDDEAVDDAVLRLTIELGGSISAEHGIGVAKARWLRLARDPADLAAMAAIKRALDPHGILNPGVLFGPA